MKKISALIAVLAVAAFFVFAGCKQQEAPKPAEQSSMTPTAPMSAPTPTAPVAAPEKK